jgi:hypothetical protein
VKEKITPFRFKVSGNLIKELGEESISNPNSAVLELIKNAHDADATKVEIDIVDLNKPVDSKIVISDNGKGMNYNELENKWMNIASPHKSSVKKTKKGRIPVGAKGIGRLASESLGRRTTLYSNPENETSGYEIHFKWEDYREENVQCSDINNEAFKFKKRKSDHGTRLTVSDLRSSWNDSTKLKSLLKDIYLIHPLNSQLPDFKVIPKKSISRISLKKPTRKLINDWAVYKFKAQLLGKTDVKYTFYMGNTKKWAETVKLSDPLECGDVLFELFFFYRTAGPYNQRLRKEPSKKELSDIKNFLDEYGGIKLYRDNFRVKPYGEKGFDWLDLQAAAQNNTMCPRNNQIIGMVKISKNTNPEIIDTTTREGVIYSQEFFDLIKFIRTAITTIWIDKRSEIESEKKKARKKARKKAKIIKVADDKEAKEELIDVKGDYPQNFYSKLQDEINECYKSNYPNAAFFLCRKLVENIIFNILEKKFKNQISLWYDTNNNCHHKLSILLKNLYIKRKDFKPNTRKYITKVYPMIGLFKKEANAKAHNIFEYINNKDELKKYKIKDIIQLLVNIHQTL